MIFEFDYTNYKGEAGHRRVRFRGLKFGSTPWHQEPQWLLKAFDLDKDAEREFALKDITNMKEITEESYNPFSPVVETMKWTS